MTHPVTDELARVGAGAVATVATSVVTDALLVDGFCVLLGAFVAMAPGETWDDRLWHGVLGLAAGAGLVLIMRSGVDNDMQVRASGFGAAVLAVKVSKWIETPAKFERDAKAIAGGLKSLLGMFGKGGGGGPS